MSILAKIIRRLSSELAFLAEQVEYGLPRSAVTAERDCFETVREVVRLYQPRNLCDVGAHSGTWTQMLHRLSPGLKDVTFIEPQEHLFGKLQALALSGVATRAYRCCVGEDSSVGVLKGGTASASLLEATSEQSQYFPNSVGTAEEVVQVRTLDEIYTTERLAQPDLIKLDVQGFELHALKGAVSMLERTKCLVIELSFRPLYTGQNSFAELLEFLEEHHFSLAARGYEWRSATTPYELVQMDGVFLKSDGERK